MGGRGGQKIKKSVTAAVASTTQSASAPAAKAPAATVAAAAPAAAPAVEVAQDKVSKDWIEISDKQLKLIQLDSDYNKGFTFKGKTNGGKNVSGFNVNEKIIYAYTDDGYKINKKIRDGIGLTKADKAYSSALSKSLNGMEAYEGEVIRMVNLSNSNVAQIKAGGQIKFNEFLSASTDGKFGKFKSHKFVIQSKRGRNIMGVSHYENEKEVLFDKGSRFKVNKIDGDTFYLTEI